MIRGVPVTRRPAAGQLQAIAPPAPAHIVKTLVDQKEPTATGGIQSRRQCCCAGLLRQAATFILNLPDQPIRGEDAPNAQLF